jgi:hypothetical protein
MEEEMSEAREALETFVKQYGSNAGYAVRFPVLLDALVAEVRAEEPATCQDCGHLEAAHTGDNDPTCNASLARVRSCTCMFYIPS